jgi:hypothetical protein
LNMRTLRDYQRRDLKRLVEALQQDDARVFLAYCVAAGKTVMALLAARLLHDMGIVTHVVFLAPSKFIRNQFEQGGERAYEGWEDGTIITPRVVALSSISARTGTERLVSYLQDPEGRLGGTWGCAAVTYDTWRNAAAEIQRELVDPVKARKVLAVTDEAHHVYIPEGKEEANKISLAVMTLGVRMLRLSGTPSRPSGTEVTNNQDVQIVRTLVESMLEGYTPGELLSEIVTVAGEGECFEGEGGGLHVPIDHDAGAEKMARHWAADGRPPLLIRIKCSSEERNQQARGAVKAAFARLGVEILDATGEECPELVEYLRLEDQGGLSMASMDERHARVIMSFRRFDEGTDCPSRAQLYLFGCPRSMEGFQQLLGRIIRLRRDHETGRPLIEGYPEEWLDRSKVVLFMAEGFNKENTEHAAFLLNLIGYLSSFKEISLLKGLLRIPDGFSGLKGASAFTDILPMIDPEQRLKARRCIEDVERLLVETSSHLDQSWKGEQFRRMVAEYIRVEGLVDVSLETVDRELVLRRLEIPEMREGLHRSWTSLLEQGLSPIEAFPLALKQLFAEFCADTRINDTTHQLDAHYVDLYSARLAFLRTGQRPKSVEEIIENVRRAQERSGVLPHGNRKPLPAFTDEVPGYPMQTFRGLDDLLRRGGEGIERMEGGLYQLVVDRLFSASRGRWHAVLDVALTEIVTHSKATAEHASNAVFKGKPESVLRQCYTYLPEVRYLPDAWRVCRLPIARDLTPDEAQRKGRELRASREDGLP